MDDRDLELPDSVIADSIEEQLAVIFGTGEDDADPDIRRMESGS